MIRYSLRVLDVDGAIPIIMQRIAKPETPNVVKTGFSQVIGSLKDARLSKEEHPQANRLGRVQLRRNG